MPLWVFLLLSVGFAGAMLFSTLGSKDSLVSAVAVIVSDGLAAAVVFVSAAGYGALLLRPLRLPDVPRPLWLATSAGVGLWFYATLMLLVGSFIPGSLNQYVWWTVVAVGGALAVGQWRGAIKGQVLPARVGGGALVWWLVAAAAGILLAGATLPPGYLGRATADSYDILEYHLQLPREYFQAGRVSTLDHNIYSHYPLSSEMLFLLAMCLRGSAYQAVYLCQMMNGLLAAVAVLAVFGLRGLPATGVGAGSNDAAGSHPPDALPAAAQSDFTARFGVALLASSPWILYLSYLAMEEMGQVAFAALALVWLKYWLARPALKAGLLLGVLLGAACCFKYLSVGLVAGPVLAVMLVLSLRHSGMAVRSGPQLDGDIILLEMARRNWRRIAQWLAVAATALVVFSPWLIRNVASTGNPVFPLAMDVFGHNGLTDEQVQRWENAHSAEYRPPVPQPPNWQAAEQTSRVDRLLGYFLWQAGQPALGAVVTLLLAGTLLSMLLRPAGVGVWAWSLLGVLALQLAVWALFTRDMPGRFLAVGVPTICLLCAVGLVRLAGVRELRFLRQNVASGSRWGTAPAVFLLVAAVILNLMSARLFLLQDLFAGPGVAGPPPSGASASWLAAQMWDGQGKVMLLGDSRAFYLPPGSIYATVYNTHPLETLLSKAHSPQDVADGLRNMGVKYIRLSPEEIRRLAYTVGWPSGLSVERMEEALGHYQATTQPNVRAELVTILAVPEVGSSATSAAASGPATRPASGPATAPTAPNSTQTGRSGSEGSP